MVKLRCWLCARFYKTFQWLYSFYCLLTLTTIGKRGAGNPSHHSVSYCLPTDDSFVLYDKHTFTGSEITLSWSPLRHKNFALATRISQLVATFSHLATEKKRSVASWRLPKKVNFRPCFILKWLKNVWKRLTKNIAHITFTQDLVRCSFCGMVRCKEAGDFDLEWVLTENVNFILKPASTFDWKKAVGLAVRLHFSQCKICVIFLVMIDCE